MEIQRHRTAKRRTGLSRPLTLAWESGLISAGTTLFDYGCGHGDDIETLSAVGIECDGWDPCFRPGTPLHRADVVNLGYVLNVIEDPAERETALAQAWSLALRLLVVAARTDLELQGYRAREFADGCLTKRGTFQKFFSQSELRELIRRVTESEPVAVAPGIFFVFRDESLGQLYQSQRYRAPLQRPSPRSHPNLYEQHREILADLEAFYLDRGRLPDTDELSSAPAVRAAFGSLRRAFSIIRKATDDAQWERVRSCRSEEVLLYLALQKLDGRPRYSQLPRAVQLDIRDFFGSYSCACEAADRLLFSAGDPGVINEACRSAPCGKLMPDSLYIHASALSRLPVALRVYEGCAKAYLGDIEGANVIKLYRREPKVSYLRYRDFDDEPHPPLTGSLLVNLRALTVRYRSFAASQNPPILHRKETLVADDYPRREEFAELTRQEEEMGLLSDSSRIGWRRNWEELLRSNGVEYDGHQLIMLRQNPEEGNRQGAGETNVG